MNSRAREGDVDVLIVGAGPVGLFLANECARRGIKFQIVEQNATQSEHSKALAIFPRTMEIFDMAGLVGPFLTAANRVTNVAVIVHGKRLAHIHFEPKESPYQFVAMVPQDVTERLLAEALRNRGGEVEYETKCVSATQEDGAVTAWLDHKGDRSEVRAAFVVGCDGAHSVIRHGLNLPLEGAEYKDLFLLADVQSNEALPADELQLCPSEFGPVAIFPMSATRRRVVATVDKQDGDAPTLELVQRILKARAPKAIEALALHWSSYFRIHHRRVSRLRDGRIFLAGDAAHIHSPFGGQGMNTGLHDIWNLVWKLDLYLRGHGSEELLDSYNAERLPVIKGVIETTDHLTKVMGTPSRLAQVLRDTIIPVVSRIAPFQHAFVQRLSELGVAYDGSPIVEGPGERYLDDSMRGGHGIKGRFLVLTNGGKSSPPERLLESFGDVVEVRPSEREGIALVRPDGYLAYSSRSGTPDTWAEVQSVLQRQAA